jgi:glycosyltransferase involved in cell wall biosynthesis
MKSENPVLRARVAVVYNGFVLMNQPYAALIPCYNVGEACVPVIRETARQVAACIVVDDGSTDDTLDWIQTVQAVNLKVVRHETNKGKGTAILTGFRLILASHPEVTAILTLDGDGQHDPALIETFIRKHQETGAELVYGNRMLNQQNMPWHRRRLNALSNRTISKICGRRILDSQCGFRLYSKKLIQTLADELKSHRYELETEILIKAARRGMKIEMAPVSTIYSKQTMKLSHHSLADVLRIARLVTTHLLGRDARRAP